MRKFNEYSDYFFFLQAVFNEVHQGLHVPAEVIAGPFATEFAEMRREKHPRLEQNNKSRASILARLGRQALPEGLFSHAAAGYAPELEADHTQKAGHLFGVLFHATSSIQAPLLAITNATATSRYRSTLLEYRLYVDALSAPTARQEIKKAVHTVRILGADYDTLASAGQSIAADHPGAAVFCVAPIHEASYDPHGELLLAAGAETVTLVDKTSPSGVGKTLPRETADAYWVRHNTNAIIVAIGGPAVSA